jgi:site-specific DNA-methyltransferase (adenine-specific)
MNQASLALPEAQPVERPRITLNQGDACEWLASLEPGSVDLIVTDPAYESLEKHRAKGTTTRLSHSNGSSNDWFAIFPNARFPEFFRLAYRALTRNAHLYVYCDQETAFAIKPMGEAAGFKFWKPIVWDKQRIGMGYHYRCRYEFVLFFEKGKRKLNDLGVPDVITCPRVVNGYPTEKPVAVSEVLISQSSEPGELVADPFMGSGSVGEATLKLRRSFAGNDLADSSIDIAAQRLEPLE